MEKIKLVIWDLDETFWKGTLSEEGISEIKYHIDVVKELTNRGIMNSICSKNDFEQVKEKLIELDLWEYFIYPSINWGPKGMAVKDIIENCQLRDVNVLFLDDNHLNLKEAKFYNHSLNVEFPEFILEILAHKAFKGKDDSSHSRLKQYKILEKKTIVREKFDDNVKFLKSSNIKIEFIKGKELLSNVDRVLELLERTNQLNFTKIRSKEQEVNSLLNDIFYECSLIRVKDDFGDYGIVGFYALHKETKTVEHFTFSCRILNLGVAQYVYSTLEFPSINIIPEVAEELDKSKPDWITEFSQKDEHIDLAPKSITKDSKKIFFKGGCDLQQMMFYLNGNNFNIYEETNYVGENNFPIHQEHTQVILDSLSLSTENKEYVEKCDYLPFTDVDYYKTKIFDNNYDCLVFSVLMDYTNELYTHKTKDITLSLGGYYNHWTEEKNDNTLFNTYTNGGISLGKDIFQKFRQQFKHLGQITPKDFIENLTKLRSLIPKEIPIIFINGAEIEVANSLEKSALSRHITMNNALSKFIEESQNTYLLDTRKVVTNASYLTNNIRHYNRETYKKLSVELLVLLNKTLDDKIKTEIGFKTMVKATVRTNASTLLSYLRKAKKKITILF